MKAQGNGSAAVCVSNLCRLLRGEVFGDRCRGIDGRLIEKHNISNELTEDVKWLIREYEPRVSTEDVEISLADSEGSFYIDVKLKNKE